MPSRAHRRPHERQTIYDICRAVLYIIEIIGTNLECCIVHRVHFND